MTYLIRYGYGTRMSYPSISAQFTECASSHIIARLNNIPIFAYSHYFSPQVSTLRKELLFSPVHSSTAPTDAPATSRPHHSRRRHHRRHRGRSGRGPFQLRALEQIVDVVYRRQQELDSELMAARRNVTVLQQWRETAERRQEQLLERAERGERQREELQWQLNVTSR